MKKSASTSTSASGKAVKEPAQVYLAADDSSLLARLAAETGLSKAEVLRRGLRSFAREQFAGRSPMLAFIEECAAEVSDAKWPIDAALHHDEILADAYRGVPRAR